jgi:carbonic anhydrase
MFQKLYHNDVYLPEEIAEAAKDLLEDPKMHFSAHLKEHLEKPDPKHLLTEDAIWKAVNNLKKSPCTPFEVETNRNKVTKAVYRTPYNKDTDISIVFRKHTIVTAWLNRKDDTHSTLDTSKYEKE